MKNTHTYYIALMVGLVLIIFSLSMCLVYQVLQPKGRVSCASFGSYDDMQYAFQRGAFQLDRDHDGKPCQEKFTQP